MGKTASKERMLLRLLSLYKFLMRYNLQSIIPVSVTRRVIRSRFKDKVYEVEGHRMYLNEGLFSLSLGQPFEPLETKIVRRFVNKGNIVIDLGANIGYFTLLFAKQVGEFGRVVAFEPSPANFKMLENNINLNSYGNVDIEQAAISDKSGRARLYLSIHPGDNRICSDTVDQKRKVNSASYIDIATVSLDDYFHASLRKIDFIEMDIQGAEYSALKGMRSILMKSKNLMMLTEFSPKLLKEFGAEASDFLHELQLYGFRIYNVNDKTKRIELTSTDDLLKRYTSKSDEYTNLVVTRQLINDESLSNLIT